MPIFRGAEEKDAPELRRIWSRSFGDSEEAMQGFLEHFGYEIGVVGEEINVITCAAYIIPTDGICFSDGPTKSCSYVYAVAVSPEFRGSGLGKALTKAAMRISKERGFDYTVLKPSDAGLFDFYRKMGFEDFSYANEICFSKSELKEPGSSSAIETINPQEYARIRENALKYSTHVKPSLRGIEYQSTLGELFSLNISGAAGCAAAEVYGERCGIKELLVPEKLIFEAVSLIASKIKGESFKAVTPVFNKSCAYANGMIYPPLELKDERAFLGLAYE